MSFQISSWMEFPGYVLNLKYSSFFLPLSMLLPHHHPLPANQRTTSSSLASIRSLDDDFEMKRSIQSVQAASPDSSTSMFMSANSHDSKRKDDKEPSTSLKTNDYWEEKATNLQNSFAGQMSHDVREVNLMVLGYKCLSVCLLICLLVRMVSAATTTLEKVQIVWLNLFRWRLI